LCAKRLKVVCFDDHCVAHIEDSYFVDGVHSDNEKERIERGIPENLRTKLLSLYNAGVKPASLISSFRKEGIILEKQQLNNFLKNEKKKKLGSKAFCLKDLIDYAETKKSVPDDINEVFVVDYEYKTEPRIEFRIFLSTKKLISFTKFSKHVLADATYKVTDEGYPSLTCGTTDKNKNFHPFGIALTMHETGDDFEFLFNSLKTASLKILGEDYSPNILIADNAAAITNGFSAVFDLFSRVNCWAHAIRNIDKYLNTLKHKPELRLKLRSDIVNLQLSSTSSLFNKGKSLFLKKYENYTDSSVVSFLTYLKDNWFKEDQNKWYEGYLPGLPSHTNNIESFHLNSLKSKDKIVTRLSCLHYLKTLESVIRDWSLDREENLFSKELNSLVPNPNLKTFAKKPVYENSYLRKAYEYNSLNKVIIRLSIEDSYLYFIPAGKQLTLTKDKCREYVEKVKTCDFDCFDKMFEYINSIHVVKLNLSSWELSECNCSFWMKDYMCYHIVSVAHRETTCKFSLHNLALSLPLQRKRDKGAKSSTKPALIRQSIDQRDEVAREVAIEHESDDDTRESDPKRVNTGGSSIVITAVPRNQPPSDDSEKCSKCGSLLMKRRYSYCPNKCKKNI
jgi:hypothetical protein